ARFDFKSASLQDAPNGCNLADILEPHFASFLDSELGKFHCPCDLRRRRHGYRCFLAELALGLVEEAPRLIGRLSLLRNVAEAIQGHLGTSLEIGNDQVRAVLPFA